MASTFGIRAAAQNFARQMGARATPASRRSMSGNTYDPKESMFANAWIKADVLPIVFIIGLASGFCAYTIGRRALAHENVHWNKAYKKVGIANQYDYKYPGTTGDGARPGAILSGGDHH
mmetsp:Transcript_39260/g.33121  ORF Transcript_39260/g.33121 Transcript_39260/m.33121 type:complete len:119 (+) Transcript_39260:1-357(+)